LQVIDDLMTISYTVANAAIRVKAVYKGKAGWLGVGMGLNRMLMVPLHAKWL
jgi:hypothetical protein